MGRAGHRKLRMHSSCEATAPAAFVSSFVVLCSPLVTSRLFSPSSLPYLSSSPFRAWPSPLTQTDLAPAGPLVSPSAKTPRENSGWFSPCSPSPKTPSPVISPIKRGYTFEVDDSGIGIPPEKREKVFENFVQAGERPIRRIASVVIIWLHLRIISSVREPLPFE